MSDAFAQATAWSPGQAEPRIGSDALWPWLIALLHHDSLASFDAYHVGVASLASRYGGAGLRSRMARISAADSVTRLARESSAVSGFHPVVRRGAIVVHTENPFTRDFLPVSAERLVPATRMLFGLRRAGLHRDNAAARIASYFILLTLHPYRDGNGRTARLLFAADTWAADAPALDLLGLAWLHGQRSTRFHLAAKCARAGSLDMLFALHAECAAQALQTLRATLSVLDASMSVGDTDTTMDAAHALHAIVALHIRQD